MTKPRFLPSWTWIFPLTSWLLLILSWFFPTPWMFALLGIGVLASVQSSVHHSEVIALKVGEPFGVLVLALSVTVIEVALILAILLKSGNETSFIARDTIFATIMVILNGLVGLCLLFGAAKFREQEFTLKGVSAALATLSVLTVVTLILPNYTTSFAGPAYTPLQMAFVALVSLFLYGIFVLVQTVRHRDYFLVHSDMHSGPPAEKKPSLRDTAIAFLLLILSLAAVVLQAKTLSPTLTEILKRWGAPEAVVGVIIAIVVLMPESLAAIRAARANHLQTSLNLALGSALATIGLTIPVIATLSVVTGNHLPMGLSAKESVLLGLTLIVSTLSLGTGKTTVLQGAVHLVLFAVYMFTTFVP